MKKTLIGVVAGFLVWSVLWLAGNLGILAPIFSDAVKAFDDGGSLSNPFYLGAALGLSVLCSHVAGWVCARLAPKTARSAVLVMATLLLLTGIAVQSSIWSRMPVWYHLVFLALIVPACLLGARSKST